MNSEQQAHAAITELMQQIWEEHRIRIDRVSVTWHTEKSVCGQVFCNIDSIDLDSRSFPHERPGNKPKENQE